MTLPSVPAIQQLGGSIVDQGGVLKNIPYAYFQLENGLLAGIAAVINGVPGVNAFTVATQPVLGPSDAGYVGYVSDYGALLLWNGATWLPLTGDRGYQIAAFAQNPGVGWGLCDGSAYNVLTLGAALTLTPFTSPDLTTGAYLKGGAYTGTVTAASAPALSGSTADESAHTHSVVIPDQNTGNPPVGAGVSAVGAAGPFTPYPHTHDVPSQTVTSGAGSAHHHGVGALVADATAEPKHLAVLWYVRL